MSDSLRSWVFALTNVSVITGRAMDLRFPLQGSPLGYTVSWIILSPGIIRTIAVVLVSIWAYNHPSESFSSLHRARAARGESRLKAWLHRGPFWR